MKKWVTSSWIYRTFDEVHSQNKSKTKNWLQGMWEYNYYKPNYDQLQVALSETTAHCNKTQMSIKALVPLTSARTHEFGTLMEYGTIAHTSAGAGIGYGWGCSNVIGFAAFLERVEEISDEEYDRRIAAADAPSLVPA